MNKQIIVTNRYKRDYKKMSKQHKNMKKLNSVVQQLSKGKKLGAKFKDHALGNNWLGCRDCHIEYDWVLIYETNPTTLTLHRTGTHAELFKL